MENIALPTAFDYVIIGGGLAGCVLASRLHLQSNILTILIVEAGPDPTGHPLTSMPLACFAAHHSELDWDYTTAPQKHLDGRPTYASAAKVLSGGNAINYGAWTRGPAVDYDHWAQVVNDQAWSYEGLLPYFRKTEHHYNSSEQDNSTQHGFAGPIYTSSVSSSDPLRKYPLRDPVRAAWHRIGVDYVADGNSGSPLGLAETVENWRDGKRQLASQTYNLSGVRVFKNTLVHRILIKESDGNKIATGVQLADGRCISAKKEVILSAGAYRTPQVLMLSGIGPTDQLTKYGIPQILNAPEVGKKFFDHLALCQWWKLCHPEQGLAMGTPLWTDPAYFKGLPSDWMVCSHVPNLDIKAALTLDEERLEGNHLLDPRTCHTETLIAYAPAGADHAGVNIPRDGSHITSAVLGMSTTSRGSITLASADPHASPVIDPNFYATEADRAAMRAGVRQVIKVLQETPEGRSMVESETPPPGYPRLHLQSTDQEIDTRVKRAGNAFYHAAGSAAMGKVTDTELRVIGIQGLRVVDASVIPVSICAHYQVCVMAIAEKAADLLGAK